MTLDKPKRYAAGPLWKPAKDDTRVEGDIIEEATHWFRVEALVNRRELVEVPYGQWEYMATRRYVGDEKPGDVVRSIEDPAMIAKLLRIKHLERVDVPAKVESSERVSIKPPKMGDIQPVAKTPSVADVRKKLGKRKK